MRIDWWGFYDSVETSNFILEGINSISHALAYLDIISEYDSRHWKALQNASGFVTKLANVTVIFCFNSKSPIVDTHIVSFNISLIANFPEDDVSRFLWCSKSVAYWIWFYGYTLWFISVNAKLNILPNARRVTFSSLGVLSVTVTWFGRNTFAEIAVI